MALNNAAYLKGSSGQYIYRVKPEAYASHLERMGGVMHKLVLELAAAYATQPSYHMLVRVFNEHFIIEENGGDDDEGLRPRQGEELSATSLQSPDDEVASYRQKRGEDFTGYVANVAETCHPANPFQLIMAVQTEPTTTDDAAMLAESLPRLKKRTGVNEMHTDGGYNSPEVDQVMRQHQVEQVQTAIRGRQPNPDKLNLDDFTWEVDPHGQPLTVTAPNGQRAAIEPGRQPNRYIARFDPPSLTLVAASTSTSPSPKPLPPPVLYFSQPQLELALRRQRSTQAHTEGCGRSQSGHSLLIYLGVVKSAPLSTTSLSFCLLVLFIGEFFQESHSAGRSKGESDHYPPHPARARPH